MMIAIAIRTRNTFLMTLLRRIRRVGVVVELLFVMVVSPFNIILFYARNIYNLGSAQPNNFPNLGPFVFNLNREENKKYNLYTNILT